jgi:hypothetical protein
MLCLDNNIVEEIVNLEHLVNLQWLDLSFNNISEIKGLEKLTKLQDVSFYNNDIQTISGLDSCTQINCLSIGNNSIKQLENLMELRKFKHLRLLNLEGNPVCNDPEYRMFVLAHLKSLKYLDYALVHESDVIAAKEQYQDELLEIEERETIEDAAAERESQREENWQLLMRANLGPVETLFTDMFKEDTELSKLQQFPGCTELLEDYRANFNALSEQFKTTGLERLKAREDEYGLFDSALTSMRDESEAEGVSIIEAFNKQKKKVFMRVKEKSMEGHIESTDFDELRKETGRMGEILMDLEIQQTEKFDDLINELENTFIEMKAASIDAQQLWFRTVEAFEDTFSNGMNQLVMDLLEKSQNDLLGEDISDEVKNLLLDRDTCLNAVAGSHDIHVGKLLQKEDDMRAREAAIFNGLVDGNREKEYTRNRGRVMEIEHLLNYNYEEMDEKVAEGRELDDDDDWGG